MSQENVEIVRRSTAAYNRRDLDGWLEDWAPDAVVDWSSARVFDAGVYRGHREIRAFAEELLGTWDEVRIEIVDGPVGGPRRPLDRRERRLRTGTRRHRRFRPEAGG
jgi:ketosteroid isomerase-like protein